MNRLKVITRLFVWRNLCLWQIIAHNLGVKRWFLAHISRPVDDWMGQSKHTRLNGSDWRLWLFSLCCVRIDNEWRWCYCYQLSGVKYYSRIVDFLIYWHIAFSQVKYFRNLFELNIFKLKNVWGQKKLHAWCLQKVQIFIFLEIKMFGASYFWVW